MRLRLDPGVKVLDSPGRLTMVGGTPLRVFNIARSAVERLGLSPLILGRASAPCLSTPSGRKAIRRLADAGILHPVPDPDPHAARRTTVVIPVRDRVESIGDLVEALAGVAAAVVVVDDASTDGTARRAEQAGARVVRLPVRRGPAAARNRGLAEVRSPLVAFLDSDVRTTPGWIDSLAGHLADPTVAVVAPRVRGDVTRWDWLARYEGEYSPQDMGPHPAYVRPDGRVTFLPAAALLARTEAVASLGGFREEMEVGEDVDLVWRAVEAGWRVRYEPDVVVYHQARQRLGPMLRRRYDYGTSAAPLDARHPGRVAPISLSTWTAALWTALVLGRWRMALGIGGWTLWRLRSTMALKVDNSWGVAVRVAGRGHLMAARTLGDAVSRTWLPLVAVSSARSRAARRVLALAWVVAPALRWWERKPSLDPARTIFLNVLDDAAYCLGVWRGCLGEGSFRALMPRRTG